MGSHEAVRGTAHFLSPSAAGDCSRVKKGLGWQGCESEENTVVLLSLLIPRHVLTIWASGNIT